MTKIPYSIIADRIGHSLFASGSAPNCEPRIANSGIVALLLAVLTLCLLRCEQPPGALSARAYVNNWPSLRDLSRTLRQQGRLLIIYGAPDTASAAAYRSWAGQVTGGGRSRLRVEVRSDSAVDRNILASEVVLLVGTPGSNRLLAELLGELPVGMEKDAMTFDGRTFSDPTTVLSLGLYPNPANRQIPLLLITGRSDDAILEVLRQSSFSGRALLGGWGYTLYQQGRRIMLGAFDDSTWTIDPARRFDFTAAATLAAATPHYRFLAHQYQPDPTALAALAAESETAVTRIEAFTGRSVSLPVLTHHLYPSPEIKGLLLENTTHSNLDRERREIHTILDTCYHRNFIGTENALILDHLLGAPHTAALGRGLAVYFTQRWQERGYAYWAGRLHRSGYRLPLSDLLDEEARDGYSPLIADCLTASFVAFLIEHWGREPFLQRYASWQPTAGELPRLEEAWHAYLERQPIPGVERPSPALPFLRGFNFTHEGYQVFNGYGSRLADAALGRLHELNGNAVAVVPYSWIGNPEQPAPLPFSNGPGSENDENVVHTLFAAHGRGLSTLLKPQIWLGGGRWPGDVAMTGEADWQQWFVHYRHWIMHYALLAEIHHADLFCIGTELVRTTLRREADWRRLIAQIRGVYSGRLTYAANWGEEFEQLAFWDALDYMGLDCYYPISKDTLASKEDLRRGFRDNARRIETVVRRSGKPLLVTEIGFSSVDHPWTMPHSDGMERGYNEAHQALCYDVALEALAGQPYLQGIFLWKWPTYLEYRGRQEGKGFPVNGKSAENVVRRWYGKMAR